jgi:glucose/arabinose dehydrogenase
MTTRARTVRAAPVAAVLVAVVLVATAACTGGSSRPTATLTSMGTPTGTPTGVASAGVRVLGTVATGLDTPWGLAFLPTGGALLGSRDTGRIVRVGAGPARTVGTVPGVVHEAEGGLLGLALSPGFAHDRLLYAYVSTATDNRVVRMTYASGRLGPPQVVLAGIPVGVIHDGGGLGFGPDGMLYVTTGETGDQSLAENHRSLGGKILRVTPDGRPAPGNPFPGSPVWSFGHRNVEGLAWDSAGRLWATEFGASAYDELNLVLPGHDYGWPATQGRTDQPGITGAVVQWPTDECGPSGIAIAHDVAWIGALTGTRLWRVPLLGTAAGRPQPFLVGRYGRLRTVSFAPDGSLWLTTSNTDGRGQVRPGDDRILRLAVR